MAITFCMLLHGLLLDGETACQKLCVACYIWGFTTEATQEGLVLFPNS